MCEKGEASKTNRRHVWVGQFIGEKAEEGRQHDAFREAVKQWNTFKRHASNADHASRQLEAQRKARTIKVMAISRMRRLT